jgi:hypothetical protein
MTGTVTARGGGGAGARQRHEGLAVGAIGATGVWLWLLVSDLVSRTPLSTPALLGRGLLSVGAGAHVSAVAGVIAFTVAHYAVWMGVGALLMAAIRRAARAPSILLAVVVGFILAQFLFVGITSILAQGRMGASAWRDLVIGDVIGWGLVAWYVLRAHAELRGELARASEDDDA